MPMLDSRRTIVPHAGLALLLAAGVMLGGCAGPGRRASAPTAATSRPAPPQDNALLVAWIADQPYVSAEAACRGIWWLWKGQSPPERFADLLDRLREARIAPRGWSPEPDDPVRRATAGYMLCRAIGLRGGLNWRLFGLGRYAWRELVYRGIALPAGELGYVRGGEFLGLLQRAGQWQVRHRRAGYPQAQLGTPPKR